MKRVISGMLLVGLLVSVGSSVQPRISTGQKLLVGSAAFVLGGAGLLYYLKKRNEELKQEASTADYAGMGASALGVVAGAGFLVKGGCEYFTQNEEVGDGPSHENVPLSGNGMGKSGGVDLFRTVMGISEDAFRKKSLRERREFIEKLEADHGLHFGDCELRSIGDLRRENAQAGPFEGEACLRLLIDPNVDVKELQADQANAGAVFQVASNFNGLESQNVFNDGNSLNRWAGVRAQGEQASVSAFPGAVYKKYCHGPYKMLDGLVQENVLQMDPQGVRVENVPGYDGLRQAYRNINVLVHREVSVTHGGNFENIIARSHTIHQVFTAALNLTRDIGFERGRRDECTYLILDAAYEGTLRAAVDLRARKVFLTLVGGGVFRNPLRLVSEVIARSQGFIDNFNLDVTVVCRMNPARLAAQQRALIGHLAARGFEVVDREGEGIEL